MAKEKRGLPEGFKLNVAKEAFEPAPPADIGDYIDENIPAPKPRRLQAARQPSPVAPPAPQPAAKAEPVHVPEPPAPEHDDPDSPLIAEEEAPATTSFRQAGARRQQRKEITLDPETLRNLNILVQDVRNSSGEPDVRVSEVLRAIIHAAHEARRNMRFDNVRARGQWGSATARALVTSLHESFIRGIGVLYNDRYQSGRLGR